MWYYLINQLRQGPFPLDQIKRLIESGTIQQDTLVWKSGLQNWAAAGETELADHFHAPPPPFGPKDYYKILGVSPTADLNEIKSAYRKRAFACHPDHGGIHEQMLEINEAREILFDPQKRADYDYARANPQNTAAQETVHQEAEKASQEAENYPREWSAFEAWMDKITKDFTEAEYRSTGNIGYTSFPKTNSVSGKAFAILGGIASSILLFPVLSIIDPKILAHMWPVLFLPPAIGAWIGTAIHRGIGAGVKAVKGSGQSNTTPPRRPAENASDASKVIISCPQCRQKLRVPSTLKAIRVTCGSCKSVFTHSGGV